MKTITISHDLARQLEISLERHEAQCDKKANDKTKDLDYRNHWTAEALRLQNYSVEFTRAQMKGKQE